MKPAEVLEELLASCTRSDKKERLVKLDEICKYEYSKKEHNMRDLSFSNIAKLAEINGIFKARVIYNHQSSDYRALIEAWQNFRGKPLSKISKDKPNREEKYYFLDKIEDKSLRKLCYMVFAERDVLKSELNLLKSATKIHVDVRSKETGLLLSKTIQEIDEFTESEIAALRNAIDEKNIKKNGWLQGSAGEILDVRSRFVFLPGFTSAISKILKKIN